MHIRDERAYQLSHSLYPLILQSDVFVGEMNLGGSGAFKELTKYDARKHMGEDVFEKLRKQLLKSFSIDLQMFNHLHPLMIMSAISNSVLEAQHSISLDEHLWNFAKENSKPTLGLESMEEQFQILHSIEAPPMYKQILSIGRHPSSVRKHTARGLKLYLEGRIHELYILSKSSMHHLRKKIIYERNAKMSAVISSSDVSLQYFITVGAGHLSGKTGILSLLKKAGWKVKPVHLLPD